MKRIRLLLATLLIWLFFFYNIERLSKPINLSTIAYLLVPFMGVVTVLAPRLRRVPTWLLIAAPVPFFLALKLWAGFPVWGAAIPLTVTEVCAIMLTTILARGVSTGVSEFESAVARISTGQVFERRTRQDEIYREVRRARIYQRPLTVMAVGVEEKSIQLAQDRMVQEAQQRLMRQYVMTGVSKALCAALDDYNIIAQSNGHFLVLLPEVTDERLPEVLERLREAVADQVGVTLQIGTASLPGDALTFESLVQKAVKEMGAPHEVQLVQPAAQPEVNFQA